MDVLHNLAFGFGHALTLHNLLFCALGCTVGTLVGLLPGLGPLATISLLLPLTYSIPTGGALIMLAGIYYGAQYGDSVSAITMKIPHASSIVACIDGYPNIVGRENVRKFHIDFGMGASFRADWRIVNIAASGNVVLNERVDDFLHVSGKTITLPVMGTITVEDGAITVWRDYFDPADIQQQLDQIKG